MKKPLFILLFGLATFVLANAQDAKPKTQSGDKSLNITINGFGGFGTNGALVATTPPANTLGDSLLSQLSELVGQRFVRPIYGVGMTFYVADNVGLRLGLGANVTTNTTPRQGDTTGKTDTETDLAVGFSPALQIHLANAGPVTVYTGFVLSVATAYAWRGVDSTRTTDNQMSFGGGAILGGEFYLLENLSLGAETQLGIEVTSTNHKLVNTGTDGPSATNIGFTTPIRVNLSFHM